MRHITIGAGIGIAGTWVPAGIGAWYGNIMLASILAALAFCATGYIVEMITFEPETIRRITE